MSEIPEDIVRAWLEEQEGFSLRIERLPECSENLLPWLEAACQIGIDAGRLSATERAAKICEEMEDLGWPDHAQAIAAAIRSQP